MTSDRARALVHALCRLGLSGLFLYAGVPKLLAPGAFAQDLSHYRVLPDLLVAPLALGLPILELVAGFALLTPGYVRGAAALIATLLALFAAAMAQAKLRGINLECGCFGAGSELQVSWAKVAIDVGLAMLAIWLALPSQVRGNPGSPSGSSQPSPSA